MFALLRVSVCTLSCAVFTAHAVMDVFPESSASAWKSVNTHDRAIPRSLEDARLLHFDAVAGARQEMRKHGHVPHSSTEYAEIGI